MTNPLKYMLENPKVNPNQLDILLKSRFFSYGKVAAGTAVVAAAVMIYTQNDSDTLCKAKQWFNDIRGSKKPEKN